MWYRIRHTGLDVYWDGHTWDRNGKIYFSRDSLKRAFRNTNGYLHNLDRSLLEIVEYHTEINDRLDVSTVIA